MSPIRNGVRSNLSKQGGRMIVVRAHPEKKPGAITNICMFLAGCYTVYEVIRRKLEFRRYEKARMREEE